MSETEERLVLRAQAGNPVAFDRLLRRYERSFYLHIFRIIGDETRSYEVLQNSYLAMVRSIHNLRSQKKFRAWALGLCTRMALRSLRQHGTFGRETTLESDPLDRAPLPDELIGDKERREEILRQVGELTPPLRSVILLHFFEELPLAEVAAALEIPLGTVKSRLHAGLRALRNQP